MVAAVSTTKPNQKVTSNGLSYQNPKRPPLLPSEAQNGPSRKPKSREVTSRYLSTSSSSSVSTTSSSNTSTTYSSSSNSIASLRTPSPMGTRTVRPAATPVQNSGSVKRSQSVDRRRPVTPASTEKSAAAKQLLNSSRSLSVSFQGQSFSIPVSKAKPPPATNNIGSVRKGTPERRKVTAEFVRPERRKVTAEFVTPERKKATAEFFTPERSKVAAELSTPARDRTENVKTSDQHRWPGRSKSLNSSFLTQSMDCGSIDKPKFGSGSVTSSSMKSVIDIYHRARIEAGLKPQSDNGEVDMKSAYGSAMSADALASDSESVSSGSTSGVHDGPTVTHGKGGPRGIVVPARFWQETNNRIRRGPELGSSMDNGNLKTAPSSKQMGNKKFLIDNPRTSPWVVPASRGLVSPLRGGLRPASPSKALTPSANTPLRGMPSPTRTNGSMVSISNNSCIMPSILSFAADARRGKVGENRIVDAHELRLLYNRNLQWRFVNAQAEAALRAQTTTAERTLYNAWLTTLKLRHSVKSKRIQLQLLRKNVKLHSILKGQRPCLENWSMIDGDHCNSLSGTICALEASTIRLPVVEGARAEVQNVKDAISSAVDVMQAMGSSMYSLLPKVEQVDSMVCELADVVASERALLDQCRDILSSMTALQVKECSLKTHLLQIKDAVCCSTTEV
ncbi:QWRF motif-containing protein 2-like [Solanum verrucosum]|uniref:QWRF motif-containing protein 2-like n=1 Tax=Solanum verrucosum TaxID=315347 RepID=UPI0020D1B986|nr:QWRF motif-containing protein 2-like [Solanum verrucosum]XP_049348264.1 QWRF motif-containing protein 2-like [Solanum verrucosum]